MRHFSSGFKRHYYGKADVIVYRLQRDAVVPEGRSPVLGATVTLLIYGDAFWPTYTTGDNTGLIATDSMKNFIQREAMNFDGGDLEGLCRFLGTAFLARYPQVEGLQISADELPYERMGQSVAFVPGGNERLAAQLEINRTGIVDVVSGLQGFKGLRLSGSAFAGFVRDEYTTLSDLHDRPLHMWLDLHWRYLISESAFSGGQISRAVRQIVHDVFRSFRSGSIQQVIHRMGTDILEQVPEIADVDLEANNRTWDAIAERGPLGVFTDARPPYGCLGLHLSRTP